MLLGLLSDSHGRAATTASAVKLLVENGAQMLIHLGDVGSVAVLDALLAVPAGHDQPLPAHVVFGNVDWDASQLTDYARTIGLIVDHPVGQLTFDHQLLIFLHGDDTEAMDQAIQRQPTWLCHGHTHRVADQKIGATRVINPGALFRASQYTAALLSTDSDQLRFLPVSNPPG